VSIYTEDGHCLGDLNTKNDTVLVARGGRGGCPDNQYAGQPGQAHNIQLDLKLLADIGLVGFPNAGKSTLLKALSRAQPKIASYPFTTIQPQLGTIAFKDLRQISIADLPGLIEGAHLNYGMGYSFLKHVERTKLLLFVVDINGFKLRPGDEHRTAFQTVLLLNRELELYKEDLLEKPAVLVVNKLDTQDGDEEFLKLQQQLHNMKEELHALPEPFRPQQLVEFDYILPVSAKKRQGTGELKFKLREVIDFHWEEQQNEKGKLVTLRKDVTSSTELDSMRLV